MLDGKATKKNDEYFEDEDAAIYRRAKAAVDVLSLFLLNLLRFCGPAQIS